MKNFIYLGIIFSLLESNQVFDMTLEEYNAFTKDPSVIMKIVKEKQDKSKELIISNKNENKQETILDTNTQVKKQEIDEEKERLKKERDRAVAIARKLALIEKQRRAQEQNSQNNDENLLNEKNNELAIIKKQLEEEKENTKNKIIQEVGLRKSLEKKLQIAKEKALLLEEEQREHLRKLTEKRKKEEYLASKYYDEYEVINKLNFNTILKEPSADILIRSLEKVLNAKSIQFDMQEIKQIILDVYNKKINNHEADLYLMQLVDLIKE